MRGTNRLRNDAQQLFCLQQVRNQLYFTGQAGAAFATSEGLAVAIRKKTGDDMSCEGCANVGVTSVTIGVTGGLDGLYFGFLFHSLDVQRAGDGRHR